MSLDNEQQYAASETPIFCGSIQDGIQIEPNLERLFKCTSGISGNTPTFIRTQINVFPRLSQKCLDQLSTDFPDTPVESLQEDMWVLWLPEASDKPLLHTATRMPEPCNMPHVDGQRVNVNFQWQEGNTSLYADAFLAAAHRLEDGATRIIVAINRTHIVASTLHFNEDYMLGLQAAESLAGINSRGLDSEMWDEIVEGQLKSQSKNRIQRNIFFQHSEYLAMSLR